MLSASRLNTQFKSAEVISCDADFRLTTNLIRKSIVSGLMEENCHLTKEASLTMMHSEKTPKQHYWLPEKDKNVEIGSKVIHDHYFPTGVVSSKIEPVAQEIMSMLPTNIQWATLCESQPELPQVKLTPPSAPDNLSIDTSTPTGVGRHASHCTPVKLLQPYTPIRKKWTQNESEVVSQSLQHLVPNSVE